MEGDAVATETECHLFPTTTQLVPNQFTNHNDNKIDKGYDSNGQIYFIPEGLCEDDEDEIGYEEQPILATTTPPIRNSSTAMHTISITVVKK